MLVGLASSKGSHIVHLSDAFDLFRKPLPGHSWPLLAFCGSRSETETQDPHVRGDHCNHTFELVRGHTEVLRVDDPDITVSDRMISL